VGRRLAGLAVCSSLILGAGSAPALATSPATRLSKPELTSVRSDAAQQLRSSVRAARALYRAESRLARAQYDLSLTPALSALKSALKDAATTAERADAQDEYAAAKESAKSTLQAARTAAAAKRDAVIDKALAEYLLATGKADVLTALKTYKDATKLAGATLELALNSARAAYKTDTSDERGKLSDAIGDATSASDQAAAWQAFEVSTRDEQEAFTTSVLSARATYKSALKKARGEFRVATGMSTRRLEELPFKI
jgi:hypothetical protein